MSYLGKATKLGKDLDQVKVNEVVKLDETLDDFCCRPGKKGLIPEWEALKDNVNKAEQSLNRLKVEIAAKLGENDRIYWDCRSTINLDYEERRQASEQWYKNYQMQVQQVHREIDPAREPGKQYFRHLNASEDLKQAARALILPTIVPHHAIKSREVRDMKASIENLDKDIIKLENELRMEMSRMNNVDWFFWTTSKIEPAMKSLVKMNYKIAKDALEAKKAVAKNYREWAIPLAEFQAQSQRGRSTTSATGSIAGSRSGSQGAGVSTSRGRESQTGTSAYPGSESSRRG